MLYCIYFTLRYLSEVVEKAENEFEVNMYAAGIGNYDETELLIITHNRSQRIFQLDSFEDLEQTVISLEERVREGMLTYVKFDNVIKMCS